VAVIRKEDTMLKKPYLIGGGLALVVIGLVLAVTSAPVTAATYPKAALAERLWKTSGHADTTGEPFRHWDSTGSVPTTCAKCHSRYGILDYMGYDGTAPNVVDNTAKTDTTIDCEVCHVDKNKGILRSWTSVTFPSGAQVDNLGPEALCMECHQGRASTTTIDAKIASSGVTNPDLPSTKLSFSDVHYFAAASTQMGTVVKGGYEYAGKEYDARFSHIAGYNACNTCHNPHSLQVNIKGCNTCHVGISDPKDIRYVGSQTDYDGDGNIDEGMYYEIQHVMDKALSTIYRYAKNVLNKPILYNGDAYPYWYVDNNGNGIADADDTTGYTAFSIRLLKAAYNYQVAKKDPNNYAHNGKYIIELLYDGIEDLNVALAAPAVAGSLSAWSEAAAPTDLSAMHREDEGHFNGASMPFRDWDASADYTVPSGCARCHSATGLAKVLAAGQGNLTENEPVANGFLCTTCHTAPPALLQVPSVIFPSGLAVNLSQDGSNLCMICHQGRASTTSMNTTINANPTSKNFSFTNIHYFPAAAIFLGTEAKGAYEFAGMTYSGRQPYPNHLAKYTTCVECHMGSMDTMEKGRWTMRDHNVAEPVKERCVSCHGNDVSQTFQGADPEKFDFEQIRPGNIPDYDADGNTRESLKDELLGLQAILYAQIKAYMLSIGMPVVYSPDAYPYWYKDTNANGILDPSEATAANSARFDAKGLRAAYNYHTMVKEPHAFIHNARYAAQILVDSIQHVGGDISAFTWR
jgi:hypothetical protein